MFKPNLTPILLIILISGCSLNKPKVYCDVDGFLEQISKQFNDWQYHADSSQFYSIIFNQNFETQDLLIFSPAKEITKYSLFSNSFNQGVFLAEYKSCNIDTVKGSMFLYSIPFSPGDTISLDSIRLVVCKANAPNSFCDLNIKHKTENGTKELFSEKNSSTSIVDITIPILKEGKNTLELKSELKGFNKKEFFYEKNVDFYYIKP